MLRLRHILYPIRSAKSLYSRLSARARQYIVERQFRNIRRGKRDQCWCGGNLLPFEWHPSYGVCADCGCYVNRQPPFPEELKRLYSFDLYWHKRAQWKSHPTIEYRPANDRADGRVDYWLGLIGRHIFSPGDVVEVGCGSGVLLSELSRRGYKCIGIEPDEQTAKWIRLNLGLDVRPGFFPEVALPKCDLFLAFDVIEHSPDPRAFMIEAARSLRSGGVAIIQAPIDRYEYQPPFGDMFQAVFDDLEHLYILTKESMHKLGSVAGVEWVAETERWRLAHEIVVFRRKG